MDRFGFRRIWRPPLLCPLAALFLIQFFWLADSRPAIAYSGVVIDETTQQPVAGALVLLGKSSVQTSSAGEFEINDPSNRIKVRAYGYLPSERVLHTPRRKPLEIVLRPFSPRALFVSLSAFDDPEQRERLFGLAKTTQLNALVIDVKSEDGTLLWDSPFFSASPKARQHRVGADGIKAMVRQLHDDGIYVIARIVVFKDDILVRHHPELALKRDDGRTVRENDGIAWADPRIKQVWTYNNAIAAKAAHLGFDEIQFDYTRFPVVRAPPRLCITECSEVRRAAIRGFLTEARARLSRYNVFIAVDIFGYASWDAGDTNTGQKLEDIAGLVDYICPMLYPSSFRNGIPASPMPLDKPDKIVNLSLRHAQLRTGLRPVRFRPWLQAFADLYFDHRLFGRVEIGLQTSAADSFGSDGWMLWHSHSLYSFEDLP